MAERIINEIVLRGTEKVRRDLERVGRTGQRSLNGLGAGGVKASAGLAATSKSATVTSASANKMNAAVARSAQVMNTAAASASAYTGSLGGVVAGLNGVAASSTASSAGVARLAGPIGAIVAAVAVLSGAITFGITAASADATAKLEETAIQVGATADEVAGLTFAFEQAGGNADLLRRGLVRINQAIGEAIGAGGEYQKSIEAIGVSLTEADGKARSSVEVFKDVAEVISQLETRSDRAAAAAEAIGPELGPQLVEALSLGRDNLDALIADFDRLYGTITQGAASSAKAFNDQFNRLGLAVQGVRDAFGRVFTESFTNFLGGLANSISEARPTVVAFGEAVRDGFAAAGAAISNILSAFEGLGAGAAELIGELIELGSAFVRLFGEIRNLTSIDLASFFSVITFGLDALGGVLFVVSEAVGALAFAVRQLADAFAYLRQVLGIGQEDIRSTGDAAEETGNRVQQLQELFRTVEIRIGAQAREDLALLQGAISSVAQQFQQDFSAISSLASSVWNQVASVAQSALSRVNSSVASLTGAVSNIWSQVVSGAQSAWNDVVRTIESAVTSITRALGGLIDFLGRVFDAAQRAAAAVASAVGLAGGGGVGFAGGGRVYGPGTSTSDSIPARLSKGEWVIQAKAVRKYGHALFAALNSMKLSVGQVRSIIAGAGGIGASGLTKAFAGFAQGGLVGAEFGSLAVPVPAGLAGGGSPSGDMVNVRIDLAGEEFQMLADRDVAERLSRFTTNEQVKSGGRKPSWYYGR